MPNKSRITSILNASTLDSSVTALPSFELSELDLETDFNFPIPSGVRLGHLAEKIVSSLIKSSTNFEILYENIQLIEDHKTIGELDFILSNQETKQLIHLELAYKFYLYDPHISSKEINNWIGPNRNDSLKEKLDKLKNKQFPLLYHPVAQAKLDKLAPKDIAQKLCLLVSLFIPYQYETLLPAAYQNAIKGYYLNLETFMSLDQSGKSYYLPPKKEWGINPSENNNWKSLKDVHAHISKSIAEKRAPLCWQKYQEAYSAFFIVWW